MRNPINYLAIFAILLWLAWMNYEARHPMLESQAVDVSHYEQVIDSLESKVTHLEARRDTIIQRVVSVQTKWRERLSEARNSGNIDTIQVPSTLPMELDSCKEVGLLLMERIEVTEFMLTLETQRADSAIEFAGQMTKVVQAKDEEIKQIKNRGRLAHAATAALAVIAVVILL